MTADLAECMAVSFAIGIAVAVPAMLFLNAAWKEITA